MKTFGEYLKENSESLYSYNRDIDNPFPQQDHNFDKLSFNNVMNPSPHPNYFDWMCDFVENSFPYLQIRYLDKKTVISVLDSLLNNKYMEAVKTLHDVGIQPKSVRDSGNHSNEVKMYRNYLKQLELNKNYKFGMNIPKAYIPIVSIDEGRLRKLYDYGIYIQNKRRNNNV